MKVGLVRAKKALDFVPYQSERVLENNTQRANWKNTQQIKNIEQQLSIRKQKRPPAKNPQENKVEEYRGFENITRSQKTKQ